MLNLEENGDGVFKFYPAASQQLRQKHSTDVCNSSRSCEAGTETNNIEAKEIVHQPSEDVM
jgi:hypothetical protein